MGLFLGLPLVVLWMAGGCLSLSGDPVVDSSPSRAGVYHTVKRHQTLWRICKTYGVDMREVARINGIKDVNRIQAGQRIFVPGAERVLHVDVHIEDLGPSGRPPAKVNLAEVKGRFVWPVEGKIIRGFDRTRQHRHDGVDIAAPGGTAVRSVDSGKVIYSGNEIKGYGNIVIIKHGPIFSSIYAHNAVNLVHEGDQVKKGQVIARVGRTGRAKGTHLHFEIRNHNKPVDPLLVLP
jgi:murein DD-endopeptidase MepM/ murein hydrolase activator NlpD